MTYFRSKTAADRYLAGRRYFHPFVIGKITEFLNIKAPLHRALDAGCGTGDSTIALSSVTEFVVGADVSYEMLRRAARQAGVAYVLAKGEELPLPDEVFQIVTVALALHWMDRDLFLREAHRVLERGGMLVMYSRFFDLEAGNSNAFRNWYSEEFLRRVPPLPRNVQPPSRAEVERHGFRNLREQHYSTGEPYTLAEFVDYLLSASNVISTIEQGAETINSAQNWLRQSLEPFFEQEAATVAFATGIHWTQKP
jgi:ubiquinone/menaquinone biosynthesis C-methylase UbiE